MIHGGRKGRNKGEKPGHCVSRGKEMQKTQDDRFIGGPAHPNRSECSTDKIEYWCCSPNTFGSQSFYH